MTVTHFHCFSYCILKWKSRDLARAEDVQPVKAKQKAGFMLVNQLAQTNYTIKVSVVHL